MGVFPSLLWLFGNRLLRETRTVDATLQTAGPRGLSTPYTSTRSIPPRLARST